MKTEIWIVYWKCCEIEHQVGSLGSYLDQRNALGGARFELEEHENYHHSGKSVGSFGIALKK